MKLKLTIPFILLIMGFTLHSFGQRTIKGTITSSEGEPLIGASVSIKGTTSGTISDIDGKYEIKAKDGDILQFSYIGFNTQDIKVDGQETIDVILTQGIQLDELVVTALGIKRDKKALGYAVQDVKGDEVSETNPNNIVSALSGRIAGAQIVTSSGQVGASSTIKIRGNKTFTGSAQPLFVVDGTPIMNSISSARSSTTYTDFGNAAMDIDPSNIESISVLKGASAAALYGSRAANGVILITTKKGTKKKGIGIEFSTSLAFDDVYILPNYQNEYGQGRNGSEYEWKLKYPDLTYQEFHDKREFKWALDGSGRRMDWDESWGSRLDVGLMVPQMDSPLDENGKPIPTPWISHPDNVKDFYETGITSGNNLSFTSTGDKASGRLTFGYTNQKGTSPNTDQEKINLGINTDIKLTDKLKVDANVNYIQLNNDNLPQQGNSMRNPLLEFNSWFGRQVDTKYLKEHYNDIVLFNGDKKAFNWMMAYPSQHPNPYWNAYKNTMSRERNRIFGNTSINYQLFKGVDLTARIGTDFFNEHRKFIYHKYSRDWTNLYENATNGTFWEQYRLQSETNADLFLKINKNLTDDLSMFTTLGANYTETFNQYATTNGTNLIVADFFSTSNFEGEPIVSFTKYKSVSNSVFGSTNLGYKSFLYLDLSLRGDWSSTLPRENRNYWYPSANLGFIFTELLNMNPDILSYGKLRGGIASVGNATSAYSLNPVFYSIGTTFNDINMFGVQSTLPTYDLKPEITTSKEFGLEMKFFYNRLGFDITYYDALTTNQLIYVDIPYSSGYSAWKKNAGSIRNKGIELQLNGTIIEGNNLTWDANLNWSTNNNKIEELSDGLEELQITSFYGSYSGTSLMAFPGKEWGAIYGNTFARNENGDIIVDKRGMPQSGDDPEILGYVNPDWVGGIRNTFGYKGFNLTALVDFRKGGDVFSYSKAIGQHAGILQATVEGGIRENGMVVDGVYENGTMLDLNGDGEPEDVSGQKNETVIAARTYWRSSRNWGELSVIDGSFIKLREVVFSYSIPKSFLNKMNIQGGTISLFGRNLALLYTDESNDVHIDPEVSSGGTVAGTGLESYQLPPSRTLGLKLNLKF